MKNIKETQVFTPPWVTHQMLDLMDQNLLCDDNTIFFEPSCGDGAMLIVIVDRLHAALLKKYKGDKEKTLADLCFKFYAIEIDSELVIACRMRIFDFLKEKLKELNKDVFSSYVLARIMQDKIECRDFFKFMKDGATMSRKLHTNEKDDRGAPTPSEKRVKQKTLRKTQNKS